jgi:urease accessory protein
MREARERLEGSTGGAADEELVLPFDLRQKSRLRARLTSGSEIAVFLPRGTVLRGGDLLRMDDGRTVRVVAQAEQVMHVECDTREGLLRAAYHLGNRHVAVQVAPAWLRLAEDHVLRQMLETGGARVKLVDAPFEPESGAYGAGATHTHEQGKGAVIHDHAPGMHAHER